MDPNYESAVIQSLANRGVIATVDQYEIGRYLSKLGTLMSDEILLRLISRNITESDVFELHSYFSRIRSVEEWQDDFEAIFSEHQSAIQRLRMKNED